MPYLDDSILRCYQVLSVLSSEHPLHLGRIFGIGLPYNAVSFYVVGENHLNASFKNIYASTQKYAAVYGKKTYVGYQKKLVISNAKVIKNGTRIIKIYPHNLKSINFKIQTH